MNNTNPKCTTGIPIAPQVTYKVAGRLFTGTRLAQAIEVCIGVSQSYALADVKNGGSQHILWEGLDEVAEKADKALGEHLQEANDWAKRENGFKQPEREAAANDEAVEARREQLQVLGYRTVEEGLAAERKKADDTEGGTLD